MLRTVSTDKKLEDGRYLFQIFRAKLEEEKLKINCPKQLKLINIYCNSDAEVA